MAIIFAEIKARYEQEHNTHKSPRTRDKLPFTYEAITPAWSSVVLAHGHNGAAVLSHTLGPVDDGTSKRRRIALEWNAAGLAARLPNKLFCKGTQILESRYRLGMNEGVQAEVDFYNLVYGTEVSPEFISKVSDEVMAEVTAGQSRPLEPLYLVIFFDALRVKIRDDAVVRNKAVYLALGVRPDGTRDVLGIWIEQTEGAKFCKTHARALDPQACTALLALHSSVGKHAQWGSACGRSKPLRNSNLDFEIDALVLPIPIPLDAARDEVVTFTGQNALCGQHHGLQTRGAETVDGHARHADRHAGAQCDLAGNVSAGSAFGIGTAHDHVVDFSSESTRLRCSCDLPRYPPFALSSPPGNGERPNSLRNALCFCAALRMVFSIVFRLSCVVARSISFSATAVLI